MTEPQSVAPLPVDAAAIILNAAERSELVARTNLLRAERQHAEASEFLRRARNAHDAASASTT